MKLQLPKWTAILLLLLVFVVTVLPNTDLDPTTLQDVHTIVLLCMVLSLTIILALASVLVSALAHARIVELSGTPSLSLATAACLRC